MKTVNKERRLANEIKELVKELNRLEYEANNIGLEVELTDNKCCASIQDKRFEVSITRVIQF